MEELSQMYKNPEGVIQETVLWLTHKLLDGEMQMRDIPIVLRVTNPILYDVAFRFDSHITCRRYVQDLQLLISDLKDTGISGYEGEWLLHSLKSALNMHPFTKEEEYIEFVQTIPEEYFAEMEQFGAVVREAISRGHKKANLR